MISKTKEEALKKTFYELGIQESDIEEKFILSKGKGGQKVNKTSTCVYIKHKPTGIEIKCHDSRSQVLNRFLARRRLAEKIEIIKKGRKSAVFKTQDKIRRQKRKRHKRAKKKMEGKYFSQEDSGTK